MVAFYYRWITWACPWTFGLMRLFTSLICMCVRFRLPIFPILAVTYDLAKVMGRSIDIYIVKNKQIALMIISPSKNCECQHCITPLMHAFIFFGGSLWLASNNNKYQTKNNNNQIHYMGGKKNWLYKNLHPNDITVIDIWLSISQINNTT